MIQHIILFFLEYRYQQKKVFLSKKKKKKRMTYTKEIQTSIAQIKFVMTIPLASIMGRAAATAIATRELRNALERKKRSVSSGFLSD